MLFFIKFISCTPQNYSLSVAIFLFFTLPAPLHESFRESRPLAHPHFFSFFIWKNQPLIKQRRDAKKAGFSIWWVILILGICGAILGFFGLKNLDITAATLSGLIGIAIIIIGLAHIFAVIGVSRIEKVVKG